MSRKWIIAIRGLQSFWNGKEKGGGVAKLSISQLFVRLTNAITQGCTFRKYSKSLPVSALHQEKQSNQVMIGINYDSGSVIKLVCWGYSLYKLHYKWIRIVRLGGSAPLVWRGFFLTQREWWEILILPNGSCIHYIPFPILCRLCLKNNRLFNI